MKGDIFESEARLILGIVIFILVLILLVAVAGGFINIGTSGIPVEWTHAKG